MYVCYVEKVLTIKDTSISPNGDTGTVLNGKGYKKIVNKYTINTYS